MNQAGRHTSASVTYNSHFKVLINAEPYDKYLKINVRLYNVKAWEKTPNIEIWFPIVGHMWYSDLKNHGSRIKPLYLFPPTWGGSQGLLEPGTYMDLEFLVNISVEDVEMMKSIADREGIVRLNIHLQFSALYNQGTVTHVTLNYSPRFILEVPKSIITQWVSQWIDAHNARYEGLPQSIPADVRHDYIEAIKCYNVGAYRAAVAMARRALQQAAEVKGAPKGDKLVNQIQWLFNQGLIDKATKNLADSVRWFGNYGAHPQEDSLSQVTKEDAESAIRALKQILIKLWT